MRLTAFLSALCCAVLLGVFAAPETAQARHRSYGGYYPSYGYSSHAPYYGGGYYYSGGYSQILQHNYPTRHVARTNIHVQPTVTHNRHLYSYPQYQVNSGYGYGYNLGYGSYGSYSHPYYGSHGRYGSYYAY